MDGPKYVSRIIYWGISSLNSHRANGPSWISDGDLVFEGDKKRPGIKNRLVGPTLVRHEGYIEYMRGGELHRTSGPAVIFDDGSKEYWVEGVEIDPVEFFAKYGVM